MAMINLSNHTLKLFRKSIFDNKALSIISTCVCGYHDKPRDKVQLAKRWAAQQKERMEAYKKYQPFKDPVPLDDIVQMIRAQANSAHTSTSEHTSPESSTASEGGATPVPTSCSHVESVIDTDVTPYKKKQKKCILCQHNIELDYKNIRLLSQFVSPFTGKIYGASITGLCIPMQIRVSKLIRRARKMGFMPIMQKREEFLKDPELFNPFIRRF